VRLGRLRHLSYAGATETEFFERADVMDTKVGTSKKDDPADVAETGFKAMMKGEGNVVSSWHNKLRTAIASVTPAGRPAEQYRNIAEPGSATSQTDIRSRTQEG
jgi:short-subunit dehydrogenase